MTGVQTCALPICARHAGAECLGAHLEGPWINPAAAGAQPGESIRPYFPESDDQILDFGRDVVKMVTFAPEVEGGLGLLEALRSRGIVASLGHSLAGQGILDACVKNEMTHITHLDRKSTRLNSSHVVISYAVFCLKKKKQKQKKEIS